MAGLTVRLGAVCTVLWLYMVVRFQHLWELDRGQAGALCVPNSVSRRASEAVRREAKHGNADAMQAAAALPVEEKCFRSWDIQVVCWPESTAAEYLCPDSPRHSVNPLDGRTRSANSAKQTNKKKHWKGFQRASHRGSGNGETETAEERQRFFSSSPSRGGDPALSQLTVSRSGIGCRMRRKSLFGWGRSDSHATPRHQSRPAIDRRRPR